MTKRRKLFIKYSLIFATVEFILGILCLTFLKNFSIILLILISLLAIFFSIYALNFWYKEKEQNKEWFISRFSYVLFIGMIGLVFGIINLVSWLQRHWK